MASSTAESTAVDELRERLGEISDLNAAGALLGWDRETVMPRGRRAGARRGLGDDRAPVARPPRRPGARRAARRASRRRPPRARGRARGDRARRAPRPRARGADPVRADGGDGARRPPRRCRPGSAPRAENDFALFQPHLERNVALRRELAACFPDADHPYDALLDAFEPGAKSATVREVFARLSAGLVPLVAAIGERPQPEPLPGHVRRRARSASWRSRWRAASASTTSAWRVDDSVHPFMSGIARTDIRVTSRWHEEDLAGHLRRHARGRPRPLRGGRRPGARPHDARAPASRSASTSRRAGCGRTRSAARRPSGRHWLPRAAELFPQLRGDGARRRSCARSTSCARR